MRALLVLIIVVAGCGSHAKKREIVEASAPARAADPAVAAYRTQLRALMPLETAALGAVAAHTGPSYTDDAALTAALEQTAIPKYKEFLGGLAKIVPGTPALVGFHGRLTTLSTNEEKALEDLDAAIAKGDGAAVLAVNGTQRQLRKDLDALVAEFEQQP